MNNACTVGKRYISVAYYIVALLMLFFADIYGAVEQRLIFFELKVLADILLDYLIGRCRLVAAEYLIAESLSKIISVAVCRLHLYIGLVGVNAQRNV